MSTKIKSKKGKKLKLVLANKKKSIKKDIVDNDSIDNDDIDDITINDDIKIETLVEIDDNDILRKNEEKEMELLKADKFPFLYPNLNDSQFNIKIAEKKEFSDNKYDGSINDIEKHAEKMCNTAFELSPHQLFVRNFLSFNTPYNSLLLYHGLGTGKTCSAIGVCEEMRDYMKQMGLAQRIIIVASPNVQDNFRLQLFDDRKLELIDGLWNIRACTGNKYIKEINPMNMEGLTKERVVSQVKRIINSYYLFMGYTEFSNYISKKSRIQDSSLDDDVINKIKIKKLKKIFNNRLIVIDEVQNIRISDDNKKKKIAINLMKLVKHIDNLRLLLLSATPMYNSYKEIIWLINLMNRNDKRSEIDIKDVFDKNGNFIIDSDGKEVGKELLKRKATGYVSFIRGENPYTFPYRIWPSMFDATHSLRSLKDYPKSQLNGKTIVQGIEHLDLYTSNIGEYQETAYNYIIEYLSHHTKSSRSSKTSLNKLSSFESMDSFGYTLLTNPLEALNITYPIQSLDNENLSTSPDELTGRTGLRRIMDFYESDDKSERYDYGYKPDILSQYGRIFSESEIGKYSSKISNIVKSVKNADGIVLIYSQYLEGGLVPVALALEEMGFTKYGTRNNLLKNNPKTNVGKYIMITGEKMYSPDNIQHIKAITNDDNTKGEKIKVVLISKAGSEGLDFKNIRQVHILEPWYNTNRIEQIIGRAVRTCSHKLLPFIERNVEIYLYGTLLSDPNIEAADMYVYRIAEIKSVLIGRVSRILKQSSVDCILNHGQTNFTEEKFNKEVNIKLANGTSIPYKIGDKPYSSVCDYMESCSYNCEPNKQIDKINLYSYDETFILLNNEKIIQKVKDLFKERYVFKKEQLIVNINVIRTYPLMQIYSALNQMIIDRNEFLIDKYGRSGNLINIGEYYMFQPSEIKSHSISTFDRNKPIDFKKDKLIINVDRNDKSPPIKTKRIVDNISDIRVDKMSTSDVLDNMKNNYDIALYPQDITRGESDWYKFCAHVIEQLNNDGVDINILKNFLIAHQVDTLMYQDKLSLLNYIYFKAELNDYEKSIKTYIDKRILVKGNIKGIFLQEKGKYKLMIKTDSDWKKAEESDYSDLADKIKSLVDNIIPKLNEVFGFINNFKGGELVFKTKDLSIRRSKGARCDQAGKKGNNGVLRTLNKILGENKYTDKNTKGTYALQLCVLEEFMLRLYNKVNHKNKIWFLGPEQASLLNIESYQR